MNETPLPRAVQAQGDAADAAIALLRESQQAADTPHAPAPAIPAPAPTPDAPTSPPPLPPENWEAKYRTLQGKYTAEVPRLSRELQASQNEVLRLTAELAVAKATPATPAAPKTDPLVDQFGDTMAQGMRAAGAEAAEAVRKELAPVLADAAEAKRLAQEALAREEAQRGVEFDQRMTQLVPRWREIDQRDDWTAFLNEFDPETGKHNGILVREAVQAYNAEGTAKVMNAFLAKIMPAAPALPPAPTEPTAEPMLTPTERLALQQVPGNAGAQQGLDSGKKIYSQKEVGEAYANIAKGRYTGEAGRALIQELDIAAAEGRIR